MSRLTYPQRQAIQKKFNVKILWSFSRVNTISQCPYAYQLTYIDKVPRSFGNCYTYWGTIIHDLIQDYYAGKTSRDEMYYKYEKEVQKFYSLKSDDPMVFPDNEKREAYLDNVKHYIYNLKKTDLQKKMAHELLAITTFNDNRYIFAGYMDSIVIDEDKVLILDYKTSGISGFSGKDLDEKLMQLISYAIYIYDYGVLMKDGLRRKFPIDKIKIVFDMVKYVNVSYKQKNGKIKTRQLERRNHIASIESQIRKQWEWLTKEDASLLKNIDESIEKAIKHNNINFLPENLSAKFKIEHCYIGKTLNQELLNMCENWVIENIEKVSKNNFKADALIKKEKNSFFCYNLCSVNDSCSYLQDAKATKKVNEEIEDMQINDLINQYLK